MNLAQATRMVLEELGLTSANGTPTKKSLPWRPSKGLKRREEDVRPIFWKNRNGSYIKRTQDWDEFPNGRWGDYRSPAFGDLGDYHLYALHGPKSPTDFTVYWGVPTTLEDLYTVFAKHCSGEIPQLPWNEQPLAFETEVIKEKLIAVNKLGFLTINSQPAVNAAPSTDKRFGWGPRGGFVYQKAYVEFFASPENVHLLIEVARKKFPSLTFHAINLKGESYTNTKGTNAVTWGVFPGKEIIQPTIVDAASFIVWKDEAFVVWKSRWLSLYPKDSPSHTFLDGIINSYFLVNVVDNNYIDGDIFQLFFETATH